MDRTGLNAAPVQKALKGIKKYKYILLTALLGVLLLLLPLLRWLPGLPHRLLPGLPQTS